MALENTFNELMQDIRRFNEETAAFINHTLHTLRNLESLVDQKINMIVEMKPSTASDGSESNGGQVERAEGESNGCRPRVAIKRSSTEPDDNGSVIKKPRMSCEAPETNGGGSGDESPDNLSEASHEGGHVRSSDDAPKDIDDEMNAHQSAMNIKADMGRNGTLEYLNQWLARVYELTTKFYTIKKCSSQMGTFTFYAAIDVNLDESKDDVHVVINSDNLYRPDIIFRFIDDCFQERKVVALLHIVTNDEQRLREDPARLETTIRAMVEPIVVHL